MCDIRVLEKVSSLGDRASVSLPLSESLLVVGRLLEEVGNMVSRSEVVENATASSISNKDVGVAFEDEVLDEDEILASGGQE
jgi:hypothetical protein